MKFLPRTLFALLSLSGILPLSSANSKPSGPFWWGISTSPYQFEDSSTTFRTDWDHFIRKHKNLEPRGDGTRSYSLYRRDIQSLKRLGVTHYRFGVEWARIEPKPGSFDMKALNHYRQIAESLRAEGIEPIVCLWHFTFPEWLTDLNRHNQHGWLHPNAAVHWQNYVSKVVEVLGPVVQVWAPQNEPNTQSVAGFVLGEFPPGSRLNVDLMKRSEAASARAFITAAQTIKSKVPNSIVMSIQNIVDWRQDPLDLLGIVYRDAKEYNVRHLDQIISAVDILGFNYYFSETASLAVPFLYLFRGGSEFSDMGWPIKPEGLVRQATYLYHRYGKELMILENGIADRGDEKRKRYIDLHLGALTKLRTSNIPVRGYFHWSLIDNFEWAHGYKKRFGLHTMDPDSFELIPKESAQLYTQWILENSEGP